MAESLESYDKRLAEIDVRRAEVMARYHAICKQEWSAATDDAKRAATRELRRLGEEWSTVHTQKYRALRGIPLNVEEMGL